MARAQKTVSIRLEADDYNFLSSLAEAHKEDLSSAVRDLLARGRILLALDQYREGKASLSKTAELAGVSMSEMMDLLVAHGITLEPRPGGLPGESGEAAGCVVGLGEPWS